MLKNNSLTYILQYSHIEWFGCGIAILNDSGVVAARVTHQCDWIWVKGFIPSTSLEVIHPTIVTSNTGCTLCPLLESSPRFVHCVICGASRSTSLWLQRGAMIRKTTSHCTRARGGSFYHMVSDHASALQSGHWKRIKKMVNSGYKQANRMKTTPSVVFLRSRNPRCSGTAPVWTTMITRHGTLLFGG